MSISYSAKLGYGFMIHQDELKEMEERDVELYEDFIDNDFTLRLDGYAETSDYFFGLIIYSLSEGEAATVPNVRKLDQSKYNRMMKQIKQYCPNRKHYLPKDYVLFCVD